MLRRLPASCAGATTLDQLGRVVVDTLAPAIAIDRFNIGLIDQSAYQFHDAFVFGHNVPGRKTGHLRTLHGTVVEQAIKCGDGFYFGHDERSAWLERFQGFGPVYDSGIRSMLAVPVRDRENVLASLVFASRDARAYGPASVELAVAVAGVVADRLVADSNLADGRSGCAPGERGE